MKDLKNFRLTSRRIGEQVFQSYAHKVNRVMILPERDLIAEISEFLNEASADSVSELAFAFTNGFKKGVSRAEFEDLLKISVINKISTPFGVDCKILAERQALSWLSTLLDENPLARVSKLTIDFTYGIEEGFSEEDLAGLLVDDVIEKSSSLMELQLLHRHPKKGRRKAAVTLHESFLEAFVNHVADVQHPSLYPTPGTCQKISGLTLAGFSCRGWFLAFVVTSIHFGLKHLTLRDMTFDNSVVEWITMVGYQPAIETIHFHNVNRRGVPRCNEDEVSLIPVVAPSSAKEPIIKTFHSRGGTEEGYASWDGRRNEAVMTCPAAMRWVALKIKYIIRPPRT